MMDLDRLFRPRSVALVGASGDPGKLTGRPLRLLSQHGFTGTVFVVNPRHDTIDGLPAVPAIDALPEAPDVAVLMVPAQQILPAARACGKRGVAHLVVFSSGFEEASGGTETAAELREIAEEYGMGLVGPNSEGLWCVPSRTILTFGSAANRETLVSGPVAVLSQSGSIGGALMRRLNDCGLGADVFVSVGNETMLGVADYLDWIVHNTSVKVVLCFLEGLRDGDRFLLAADRARRAGVAVVVLKAGESESGRAASASHTGKISSSATVYRSLLAQVGVVQVHRLDELPAAAVLLAGPRLPAPAADAGRGVSVLGLSGGSRSVIADACSELDVPLATLGEATVAELDRTIPSFGATTNPVDPTGQVLSQPDLYERTVAALAKDANTEALLLQYANGGLRMIEHHLPMLDRLARTYQRPLVVSSLLDQLPAGSALDEALAGGRIGFVADPLAAVSALSALYRLRAGADKPPLSERPATDSERPVTGWFDTVDLVGSAGISAPVELVVPAGAEHEELRRLLDEHAMAAPFVVKPVPDDVDHKSDAGMVHLGCESARTAWEALRDIRARAPELTRAVVQEQVEVGLEMLVVLELDTDFGPVLGIGPGGYLVELVGEIAYVRLPCTSADIEHAIDRTRLGSVFRGHRGRPVVPTRPVAERLRALGDAYVRLARPPDLLELNPVCVRTGTTELYVLDALVRGGTSD